MPKGGKPGYSGIQTAVQRERQVVEKGRVKVYSQERGAQGWESTSTQEKWPNLRGEIQKQHYIREKI